MGKTKGKFSDRQQSMMKFVSDYFQNDQRPPTIREIGEACAISSTSVVTYNLNKLEDRGYLTRDRDVSRGIRLTEEGSAWLAETYGVVNQMAKQLSTSVNAVAQKIERLVSVPVMGQIVAGLPIESYPNYDPDDCIELASSMLPENPGDLFALKVKGDSMIDAMVNDGDLVVMKKQSIAENGDMVAAWDNNKEEMTLKHFYNEGSLVRLQPANPTMEPIFLRPEHCDIQGKVVMVVRQTA
jgi:repressor LexA